MTRDSSRALAAEQTATEPTTEDEQVSRLSEVLRHYRTLSQPCYAVLVTGPWGTGKTHQVLECVPERERLYVSLFGLSTAEEVHAAVLAAAFPDAEVVDKTMKAMGDAGKGSALGAMATLVSGFGTAVLRQQLKPDRVLIFDDVERCSLELVTLLGVINDYLEHRGFHVVLITDVGELRGEKDEDFGRFREKLVGHVIEVEPQTGPAFDAFLARIKNEALRVRVAHHRDAILQAFERAKASSLRVLRIVIDDVARLLEILPQEHARRGDAVAALVQLLVTLAVEVEVRKLSKEDLTKRVLSEDRMWAEVREMRRGESNALDEARKRHPGVELRDPLLPNELAIDMIVHGRFDPTALTEALNRDARFVGPEEAPAWRIIWHNEDTDDVVERAVERFLQQLERREFAVLGEMLHAFCLRVRLARLGYDRAGESVEAAAAENACYIDDLHDSGRLPPPPSTTSEHFIVDGSHGGLGYICSGNEEKAILERTSQYLWEKMAQARRERFPEMAYGLVALAESDPVAFNDAVRRDVGGASDTAEHPVLPTVSARDFVDGWLRGPKPGWRYVTRGLQGRYAADRTDLWNDERNWIKEVIAVLHDRAKAAGGLRGEAITRIIPCELEAKISDEDATKDGESSGR